MKFFPDGRFPAGYLELHIFNTSDEANALGYHGLTPQGRPYGRVFLDAGKWTVTASHEAIEMFGDAWCASWTDMPDGSEVADELGDPVENDTYTLKLVTGEQAEVSNFLLESWFRASEPPPYDYLAKLNKPFTMTRDGYMIVRKNGKTTQIFGDSYPEEKKICKLHPASRTSRRLSVEPLCPPAKPVSVTIPVIGGN